MLLGCGVNFSLISAQAYMLSTAQPIYIIYIALISNVLFSVFLKKFRPPKIKFSTFSVLAIGLYLIALASLALPFYSDFLRAFFWLFLASFGNRFFLWMTGEIALKHLDPARAQSYFGYLATADEMGTLLAVILLKGYGNFLSLNQTIYGISILFLGIMVWMLFQFVPKRNFEITYTKKTVDSPVIDQKVLQSFILSFSLLSLALGAFKVGEDYFIKVILKENLGSYEAIRDMVANFTLIACLLTILVSAVLGRIIQQKHLSPISLIFFQTFLLLAVAASCLVFPYFYLFIAFDVVRRVLQNCFYSPANQMILSSFIGDVRSRLQSSYHFYYSILSGVSLSLVFSFTQTLQPSLQRGILLILVVLFLSLGLVMTQRVGRTLIQTLYAYVASGHKTASIIAVHMLSFLRPKGYGKQMSELLSLTPKKLLRKTIIVGLGYDKQDASLDFIINEFQSDKEEIQLAVLDALKVSRKYKATQFMVKIIMAQQKPKSLRVRMNATAIVAGIYGRKAIPFLLNGLEDYDPRIVANTLETLLIYKDKALLPYFAKFVNSTNPRIRANALMGLASFRATRETYLQTVREILKGNDLKMISSVLYVIGKRKDSHFKKELEELFASPLRNEPIIKASLAWVLMQLGDSRGFDLMGDLLSLPYEEGSQQASLHFFSQLNQETRFDLIQYLMIHRGEDSSLIVNMGNHLRHSIFDFHAEIEYLHLLTDKLKR